MSVVSRDCPKCPLCGSKAVMIDYEDENHNTAYTVICLNVERCGMSSGICHSQTEALQKWAEQKDYAERVKAERRTRA